MIIFSISIALATFIEKDFGSNAAKAIVYNSIWFELIMALLIINLISNIFSYNMFRRGKISLLIFHFAFVFVLIGAFITRYFGLDGMIHIRESGIINEFISEANYMKIEIQSKDKSYIIIQKVIISPLSVNSLSKRIKIDDKKIKFKSIKYVPNLNETDGQIPVNKNVYRGEDFMENTEFIRVKVSVDNRIDYIDVPKNEGILIGDKKHVIDGLAVSITYGPSVHKLPFYLKLNDFLLERYPGSQSPSVYQSVVQLIDKEQGIDYEFDILMNRVLKHRGYRFYQSSYDADEKGTILSVNKDPIGIFLTYFGYLLLTVGMLTSLFNRNSRFQQLRKVCQISIFCLFFFLNAKAKASEINVWKDSIDYYSINEDHAKKFGELFFQDTQGRIKPINTLGSEVLRKVSRKEEFYKMNTDQVILGMLVFPDYWKNMPLIKVSNPEIRNLLKLNGKYVSFNQITKTNGFENYILAPYIEDAYRKKPADRSKLDNEMIKVDERVNICYFVFRESIFKIFPNPDKKADPDWFSPVVEHSEKKTNEKIVLNQLFSSYCKEVRKAVKTNRWDLANNKLSIIRSYQKKYGDESVTSDSKQRAEIWYNNSKIFHRVANNYGVFGGLLLIINFLAFLSDRVNVQFYNKIGFSLLLVIFIAHSLGLGIRWYISEHAPWSNGFEALIYIAWSTVFAGFVFSRNSFIALPVSAVLSFVILFVAHLSWMDPEITILVPVLKSVWLVFHVAIITASYGFLALAAVLGLTNMFLMIFITKPKAKKINHQMIKLTKIIEMALILGLYMLVIGTFLGAVWANEAWGRYWGWDAKEAWALITCIIYAFIIHVRLIPGLKGIYTFNLFSLFGFTSIIMTYFGVNYYLSGLHSYAQGESSSIPAFMIFSFAILAMISLTAYFKYRMVKEKFL